MNKQDLFEAMAEVGDDLIVMAARKRFHSPWRRWGQLAAVLAVVVCVGAAALPYFPMGCGSSTEKAENPYLMDTMETTAAATEAVEEETVEEAPEQVPQAEIDEKADGAGKENDMMLIPEDVTWAVCRGTYFYLTPPMDGVAPLGEKLGTITQAEEPSLVGCKVYTMPGAAWFENYAVDGLAVTQEIYVQTPSGYRCGVTVNEKIISRYTYEDVTLAIHEGNLQWLADTFVTPIETYGDVTFSKPQELSSEELNTIFLASANMNTGINLSQIWPNLDDSSYSIALSQVTWRLSRFLDGGYTYLPQETAAYDAATDRLLYTAQELANYEPVELEPVFAQAENSRLILQVELPDGGIKEYRIRFDEDSWRYESIVALN